MLSWQVVCFPVCLCKLVAEKPFVLTENMCFLWAAYWLIVLVHLPLIPQLDDKHVPCGLLWLTWEPYQARVLWSPRFAPMARLRFGSSISPYPSPCSGVHQQSCIVWGLVHETLLHFLLPWPQRWSLSISIILTLHLLSSSEHRNVPKEDPKEGG